MLVGPRVVFGLAPSDIDELSGETLEGVAGQTVVRLRQALDESREARTLAVLLRSAALALGGLSLGLLALWGVSRSRRASARRLVGPVGENGRADGARERRGVARHARVRD